jgi:predicted permease
LSDNGVNERVWGYLVTGDYFEVLGVKPALGRFFTPDDNKSPGGHPVAVLTYECWQKRFAGDPRAIGKTVIVNGRNFTVIGVAPQGFYGSEIIYRPEIWFPMMMQAQVEAGGSTLEARGFSGFFVQGRLKPGVTMSQAETDLRAITTQLARDFPNENEGMAVTLSPAGLLGAWMRGPVIGYSSVLMAVVGLVLLLACANLANLLLARATERRKEIAVRLAIGASRWRLVRQLLTESTLLSTLGGALGFLLAYWLVDAMMALKPPMDITLSTELHIDGRVLLFTVRFGDDGRDLWPIACFAIYKTGSRAGVEKRSLAGRLSPFVAAQRPGRVAGFIIADLIDLRGSGAARIAARAIARPGFCAAEGAGNVLRFNFAWVRCRART